MKLSLPRQKKRKAAAAAASVEQTGLARLRTRLLLFGVALLLILAWVLYQVTAYSMNRVIDQEVGVTAGQIASRITMLVDFYGDTAGSLAGSAELARLLARGDRIELQAQEQRLREVFPRAISVQLLPPGLDAVDDTRIPPLSYAALAQLRAAESDGPPPLAEMHLLNTPKQHVNIVRAVRSPAGTAIVGHLRVALPHVMLQEAIGELQETGGYVELQQAGEKGQPVVIATHGDGQYKGRTADRVVPVAGTRWQVAYWPEISSFVVLGKLGLVVLVATGVAVFALATLVIGGFRRIDRGIHHFENSLVSLLEDIKQGQVRREYNSGLRELEDSLVTVIRLGQGLQREQQASHTAPPRAPVRTPPPATPRQEVTHQAAPPAASSASSFESTVPTESLIVEEGMSTAARNESSVDPSIFRAYDIRGVVDQTLTTAAVRQIGRAIGSEALQRGRNTVVVGRDGRLSGPALSQALMEGIISTGCNVKDIGCVPTPVLYYATHYLETQTGVVVTGSHNPPDYNGLKIVIDGETLSGESIQGLRERIEREQFISGQGSIQTLNIIPDYLERIGSDVSLARPLQVVIDCGNGVAGHVAPDLIRALGCDVKELYCKVDGNFPNHHPDPSKEENLTDLIDMVRASSADIGLAFDGDGDRLGVVTSSGKIVWPDRVLMLFARDILERNPGGQIIYDVKCTRFLDKLIRENGGQPLMWKTGHSFIKAKIKESGALLAGEMSGHIFIKERWYGFDDALYAAARLLEILAKDSRASDTVFAELPDSVNTPELNIKMNEGEPPVFIQGLLDTAEFEGANVSTIDGLRADFPDGWGLVRASNTTPVLVLRFEADNQEALARIMGEFRREMIKVNPHLSLPF